MIPSVKKKLRQLLRLVKADEDAIAAGELVVEINALLRAKFTRLQNELSSTTYKAERLKESIKLFEEATGLDVTGMDLPFWGKGFGAAVNAMMAAGPRRQRIFEFELFLSYVDEDRQRLLAALAAMKAWHEQAEKGEQ